VISRAKSGYCVSLIPSISFYRLQSTSDREENGDIWNICLLRAGEDSNEWYYPLQRKPLRVRAIGII
jgi:hypothetical protein